MKLGKIVSSLALAAVLTAFVGWAPGASADNGATTPHKHWKAFHHVFRKGECVGFNLATVQKVASIKEATPAQRKAAREACSMKPGSSTGSGTGTPSSG